MIKLEVGKKYRMRSYPASYEYVLIVNKESDMGLESHSNFNQKPSELYNGVIFYKTFGQLHRMPDLCTWGENGEWDGAFFNDPNAIVEELK